MTTHDERRGALDAVDRIVNRGGDAGDVLCAALDVLGRLYGFAAIRFVEGGGSEVGARAEPESVTSRPIRFSGLQVAELDVAAAPAEDEAFLDRVALLISPYCLSR